MAIVGAGISGSYAAWRLRKRDLKVEVFELEDRVGGRILTERLEHGSPFVNAELGAIYYIPQQHKLLNWSIHALGLTPTVHRPPNPDHTTYYLRGVHLPHRELTVTTKVPYKLLPEEQNLEPEDLKRWVLSLWMYIMKQKNQLTLFNNFMEENERFTPQTPCSPKSNRGMSVDLRNSPEKLDIVILRI